MTLGEINIADANFRFWIVAGIFTIIVLLMYIAFWKDSPHRKRHTPS